MAESAGAVEICIIKKEKAVSHEITVGIRTVSGTAAENVNFVPFDEVVTIKKKDDQYILKVEIIDNHDWQPDLDFHIELYDPNIEDYPKMEGDDTGCKVTVLDEDVPGTLSFENTDLRVSKSAKKVDITIVRSEGSDGKINCMVRTEPITDHKTS